MGSRTCTYMLRTIRQVQPCNPLAGLSIPKCTRDYRLKAPLPLLSDILTLRSAVSSAVVPIRWFSDKTPPCSEANSMTADWIDGPTTDSPAISDVNHVSPLNERVGLKLEQLASSHKRLQSFTTIALYKCTTPREVLNIFSNPSYKKDELFEGVIKLWDTFLALNEKQKVSERDFIVDHPHFCNLTRGVEKMAPALSPEALVRTLYVFVRLKINQQSQLIQNLLQICQEHLSSLNEVELAILANTLEWLRSDKNVDMLKFGLRLLIDMKIEEVNGVAPLLTMMKAVGRTAPLSLKLKLENKALQMVDRLSVAQSEYLFCVLADIDFYSEHLLNSCSHKLIDGIDDLSYAKIVGLLSCCYELDYSNEKMLTAVGDHILKTICLWKPRQVAMILKYFVLLHFRHVALLDRYAEIFKSLNSVKICDLSEAVKFYSILNHLPKNTQQFLEAVNTSLKTNLDSIPPKKLLSIVYSLCILGVCPDIAIDKLLQYESVLNLKEDRIGMHVNHCWMMDKACSNSHSFQSLKTVPASTAEDVQTFHAYMKKFITDPNLYQHSLLIDNTYYIDFMLALDTQENKLVPVGDIQTDGLPTADRSKNIARVAVLCCSPNAFALGSLHPLGKLALKIRILMSFGFSVEVVPVHLFVKLTEEEKVEFTRTMIFPGLSDNQNTLEDKSDK